MQQFIRNDLGYFVYRDSLIFQYEVNGNRYGSILNTNSRYINALYDPPFFITQTSVLCHGEPRKAILDDFNTYRLVVPCDFEKFC